MVDHGSGMLVLTIPVTLNDGQWHQIDVWRQGKVSQLDILNYFKFVTVNHDVKFWQTFQLRMQ